MRTNGLVITKIYANRLLLDVRGPATSIQPAFHVTLRTYHHRTARDFFARLTSEPTVDVSLPIADVSGLEKYLSRLSGTCIMPCKGVARTPVRPQWLSYVPAPDFRKAYVPGTLLVDGSAVSVGLVQFEGFYASDIAAYATLAGGGRTNIPGIKAYFVDSFNGLPNTNDPKGIMEASLDIEMSMSMADFGWAMSEIVVFEGNRTNFIPNDVLNTMVASNTVKNLSSSWSWNWWTHGNYRYHTQGHVCRRGRSFTNAAGDSDAFQPGFVDSPYQTTTPCSSSCTPGLMAPPKHHLWPTGGPMRQNPSWNWGFDLSAHWSLCRRASGGISTAYAIPAWQQGINSFLNNGGSTTARNIPDVAPTADNVWVNCNLTTADVGGTSCAAPLWAGFLALVNQSGGHQRQAARASPATPPCTELANESIYPSVSHDITAGNNTRAGSPNAFYAVPGYDLCTGVGSPAGTNLINALINPDPLVVISNGGFTAVQTPAGTFNLFLGYF